MIKNLLLLLSVASVLDGCLVAGALAGETKTVEMAVPTGYDSIDVSGGVSVTWSEDASVISVTADSAVLPYLKIEESGETLKIYVKDVYRFVKGIGRVLVVLPANDRLNEVELSSASSFESEIPLYASSFSVDLSSASAFKANIVAQDEISMELSGASAIVSSVKSPSVKIEASGASSAKLSGEAGKVSVELSGASAVSTRGERISAAEVDCSVSGASRLYVNCTSTISGTVSGASAIFYGNDGARVYVQNSGASSVQAD